MSIVINDGDSAPIAVHNITLKHLAGKHDQRTHSHGGKGGASSAGGGAEDDGSLKVGDNLDGVTNAEGMKVTINAGPHAGKPARVDSSNLDGTIHSVAFQTTNASGKKVTDFTSIAGKDLIVRPGN